MQTSLKWVNELINVETINLDNLINKLTLGGFEVEEILSVKIDNNKIITLDISATANRSDSLSIQGLSLELAALLNYPPKISNYSIKAFLWFEKFQNQFETSLMNQHCSGFISLTIENLTNPIAPKWLKEKLITSGLILENNLKDFQNYILLETGYPFEFYDLDKIYSKVKNSNFDLNLTYKTNIKEFTANNGLRYNLNESILILKANNIPISIAGIISHKDISYSTNTKSLLIEGSIFNAAKIRQQARTLGLRTDRSARYEKSLKNTNLLESFYRLICLLRIENSNLICKLHTITKPLEEKNKILDLNYQNVKQILGPIKKQGNTHHEYISPDLITNSLTRLNFDVKYSKEKSIWKVIIPSLRNDDIVQEIDLIEEIGRLYGFENFLTRLPTVKTIGTEDFDYQTRKKLTACFINLGLTELVQYSLVKKKTYINNEVKLVNPLINDYSNLRLSLLPNLVKAVEENVKKSQSILEGFEYGHVFLKTSFETIEENEYIGGILGGAKAKSSWSTSTELLNWFEAKGKIEQVFKKLNLDIYWRQSNPIKEKILFHPYCTGVVSLINGTTLGVFGQIHPNISKRLNISNDIYLFEFNFELIKNQIQQNKRILYQEYSLYPKIVKDLSFIIPNDVSFNQLEEVLYLNGSKFLTNINLLDEYYGESIPENYISLCLQLIFQSEQETLKNKTVEIIINTLKDILMTKFKAILRV